MVPFLFVERFGHNVVGTNPPGAEEPSFEMFFCVESIDVFKLKT